MKDKITSINGIGMRFLQHIPHSWKRLRRIILNILRSKHNWLRFENDIFKNMFVTTS